MLDRLNDGHVNIAAYVTDDNFKEFISDTLEARPDVTDYAVGDAFCEPFSFEYSVGEASQLVVILKKEDALSRNTGRFEITKDSDIKSGIYFSMLYGTGNNYAVGDTIKVTFLGEEFEYTVCGFFNSAMIGKFGILSLLFTEDKFEEFSKNAAALKSVYVSVKICAGILSAMAFLVLLIGAVVIASNIANYIQENMQNLNALKAVEYTSGQIISIYYREKYIVICP